MVQPGGARFAYLCELSSNCKASSGSLSVTREREGHPGCGQGPLELLPAPTPHFITRSWQESARFNGAPSNGALYIMVHHLMVRYIMVRHLMVRYIVSIRHFLTLHSVNKTLFDAI